MAITRFVFIEENVFFLRVFFFLNLWLITRYNR